MGSEMNDTGSEWTLLASTARAQRILRPEEEASLLSAAAAGDARARDDLVLTHLRLALRMANRMRGYGMPHGEVVAEAVAGIILAIDRFKPDQGARLATYALIWMRASVNEYLIRNWSLVRFPGSASHRSMFFRLKAIKRKLGIDGPMTEGSEALRRFMDETGFDARAVVEMDRAMTMREFSLNTPISKEEGGGEAIDVMASGDPDPYHLLAEVQIETVRVRAIEEALATLGERERDIARARLLTEDGPTLEELGHVYGVTRERIRQIEAKALQKISRHLRLNHSADVLLAA